MATGTAGDTARQYASQQVHYLRKNITFNTPGTGVAAVVGYMPANAVVVGGGVHVTTAFNGSGTDLLDVGFIGGTTDADAYGTLLQLNAVGYIILDELAATTNIMQSVTTTVTATYTDQNTNSSAGSAEVVIMYVVDNDG